MFIRSWIDHAGKILWNKKHIGVIQTMRVMEKRLIAVLAVAIIVVASGLIFSLIENMHVSSNENQELKTVKEAVQNQLSLNKHHKKKKKTATTQTTTQEETTQQITTESTQATTQEATQSTQEETTQVPQNDENASNIMNGDDGYLLPDADVTYLNREDLEKMSTEEIRYAIDEIYARHGLKFKDLQEKEFFEKKKWYIAMTDDQNAITLNEYETANKAALEEILGQREAK